MCEIVSNTSVYFTSTFDEATAEWKKKNEEIFFVGTDQSNQQNQILTNQILTSLPFFARTTEADIITEFKNMLVF